jgi:hypothetical protein
MPLPKKTIRVLPNPWAFIHHELGPQGHCHEDTGGRGTTPRYIGSEVCPEKTVKLADYESDPTETRLDPWRIVFRFPALDADLLAPAEGFEKGIELPKTAYYLDRLRDGDLIPADERSAEHGARFATLAEAKAAAVADFEAHYGEGSFAEVMGELASLTARAGASDVADDSSDAPKAPAAAPASSSAPASTPSAPSAPAAAEASDSDATDTTTTAETPNAKRARAGAAK